ncbi:MAG TPA: ribose 5-phosphate isomerase B [Pelolinea sp.]|nr:ribose 5-phosphate isomerase B [Pelolinea sp.]
MRVAVSSDHAGFPIKEAVIETVKELGYEVLDLGTNNKNRVDYPDFAEKAGQVIISGQAERGIVMCGSGIGVCITLNKMKGIYAGLCHDTYSAHQGVEHDDMNVLCLGGQIIGPELAKDIVRSFLKATPINQGRYLVRINKFKAIEKDFFK